MPNSTKVKPGDNLDAMKIRVGEKGFTFDYIFDKDQSVYLKFGATKTPQIFFTKNTN